MSKHGKAMTSDELMRATLPPAFALPVEIRERQDGGWRVFYPDPGWIPCEPVCRLKDRDRNHKHDYDQRWIESNYHPTSYDDALEWAWSLGHGEPRIVPFVPLYERKAQRKALADASAKAS